MRRVLSSRVSDRALGSLASFDDGADELSPEIAAALEALDDIAFRTGAAVSASDLARVVEKFGLPADDAAVLRVRATELRLLSGEQERDDDDPMMIVARRRSTPGIDDYNSLKGYWRAVGSYPLLTAAQEVDLARRYRQGLDASEALKRPRERSAAERADLVVRVREGRLAKETFICSNLRLVASVTRPYRGQGLDLPDLLQEGTLGLVRAVEKFDHTIGYKFSTYAIWWIRQAATRALANKGRVIRLPVHVHDLVRKIIRAERRLCWELEREPTIADIAERLAIDSGHVAFIMDVARDVISLDAPVGNDDGDTTLIEFIVGATPSVEEQVFDSMRADALLAALAVLSQRQAAVLSLRYGLDGGIPRTLDEIGRTLNVTRERIRQIQNEAEKALGPVLRARGFGDLDPATPRPEPEPPLRTPVHATRKGRDLESAARK